METLLGNGLLWWVSVVEVPVMTGLFLLIMRGRKESEQAVRHLRELLEVRSSQLREALSSFKLEVAKHYAPASEMRELEDRIVAHLLRIEAKLDKTALKTEALQAQK